VLKKVEEGDEKDSRILKLKENELSEKESQKVEIKKEEDAFRDELQKGWLRRSSRIRIPKRTSSSNASGSSSSSSDEVMGSDHEENGFKSYELIIPSVRENQFRADDINWEIDACKEWKRAGKKIQKIETKVYQI
jgi:iron-sulfur cluster repair protein YtfE (RIC family)